MVVYVRGIYVMDNGFRMFEIKEVWKRRKDIPKEFRKIFDDLDVGEIREIDGFVYYMC